MTDQTQSKRCSKCHAVKPRSEFPTRNGGRSVRARCRDCTNEDQRVKYRTLVGKDDPRPRVRYENATDPIDAPIPGTHLKGTSTLVDANGATVAQWIKTRTDPAEQLERLRDAIFNALDERGTGPLPQIDPAPIGNDDDSIMLYPVGDHHFGMLGWAREVGDDYDLSIATDYLTTAVDQLMLVTPPTKRALVAVLGDFTHADNSKSTTSAGTRLDTDSRYAKMVDAAMLALIRTVERALEKHEVVDVIVVAGNHDGDVAVMLATALRYIFRDNPRVTVAEPSAKFHFLEFGKNLFGFTHGDTCKIDALPLLMATDKPDAWGRTEFRTWFTGHLHHKKIAEYNGCTVEVARVLPGKDFWHYANGYRSLQEMQAIEFDREFGEVNRHTIGIRRIRRLLAKE